MAEFLQDLPAKVVSLHVHLRDEVISEGTGFVFLPDGKVVTAAHVVTGRTPIREEDVTDPDVAVWGQARGGVSSRYRVLLCGITVQVEFLRAPIQLDLAILEPELAPSQPVPHLLAATRPPKLGEEVFLAGFSEEIALPFSVERIIDPAAKGMADFRDAMSKGYSAEMMSLMLKRGVVGNTRGFEFSSSTTGYSVQGDIFYVDNGMNPGASGGPVVDSVGDAIGFISQRALTSVATVDHPELNVPAGSTLCLSLRCLTSLNTAMRPNNPLEQTR